MFDMKQHKRIYYRKNLMHIQERARKYHREHAEEINKRKKELYVINRKSNKGYKPRKTPIRCKIKMIDVTINEVVGIYESIVACVDDTGISHVTIGKSLNENRITKHGLRLKELLNKIDFCLFYVRPMRPRA